MNQFNLQNPWPFRDQELIKLWNDGIRTKAIASKMRLSRNSILGRVKRLRANGVKLEERGDPINRKGPKLTPEQQAKKEKLRAKQRYQERVKAAGGVVRTYEPKPPKIEVPTPGAPAEGSMSFLDAVDTGKCLWGYGDLRSKGLVCGTDRGGGSRSYWAAHQAQSTDKKIGGEARINYQVRPITGVTM